LGILAPKIQLFKNLKNGISGPGKNLRS